MYKRKVAWFLATSLAAGLTMTSVASDVTTEDNAAMQSGQKTETPAKEQTQTETEPTAEPTIPETQAETQPESKPQPETSKETEQVPAQTESETESESETEETELPADESESDGETETGRESETGQETESTESTETETESQAQTEREDPAQTEAEAAETETESESESETESETETETETESEKKDTKKDKKKDKNKQVTTAVTDAGLGELYLAVSGYPVTDLTENEKDAYRYLREELELNKAAAAGVLANMYCESNFSSIAIGDGGTSLGLCQWHAERCRALIGWCQNNDFDYRSVEGQLHFLGYELEQVFPGVYADLKQVPDTSEGAYQAGYLFCYDFERPDSIQTRSDARGKIASTVYFAADLDSFLEEEEESEALTEEETEGSSEGESEAAEETESETETETETETEF